MSACRNGPDPSTNARAIPIHRTSSYVFNDTEHASSLFARRELVNIDSRLMNPTHDALEQRIVALEVVAAGLAHSSGTSAVFNSINTVCQAVMRSSLPTICKVAHLQCSMTSFLSLD